MVKQYGVYQSLHNFEVGERVKNALLSFDESRFERVSAVAFCGIVELSGIVSNYFDKLVALRIAKKVMGVSTVLESIQTEENCSVPYPSIERSPLQRDSISSSLAMNRKLRRFDLATG